MKAFLVILAIHSTLECLCPISGESREQHYDSRAAQLFCDSDFCLETGIKGEYHVTNDTIEYNVRLMRLLRFTPEALKALKGARLSTPKSDCGVTLRKTSIYYLCGRIIDGTPVVTNCDFIKRSENLSLHERAFFTSGYSKTTCKSGQSQTPFPTLPPLPHLATLPPFAVRTTRRGVLSPSGVEPMEINAKYFCILIAINAKALESLLKSGTVAPSEGQYIHFCPQKFFCLPENPKNASLLEFKSSLVCGEDSHETYLMAPWALSSLSHLEIEKKFEISFCSQTFVEIECNQTSRVILSDGSKLEFSPQTRITHFWTPDGSQVVFNARQSSKLRTPDGTECRVSPLGSSLTLFGNNSLQVSQHLEVDLALMDGSSLTFNSNGMSLHLPDGTVVLSSEFGMIVTTSDGNQTLIPVDSKGTLIRTKLTTIDVTEGLNAVIHVTNGSRVIISLNETTAETSGGHSVKVRSEGMISVQTTDGATLVFSPQITRMTSSDGTLVALSVDDSFLISNSNHVTVVFPNEKLLVVTKEEIISMTEESTVVTDALGSNSVPRLDSRGIICEEFSCFQSFY